MAIELLRGGGFLKEVVARFVFAEGAWVDYKNKVLLC